MAIAIPGTLMARAAARKRQCLSRQGQLAITVQLYEENKGELPPYIYERMEGGDKTHNIPWPVLLFEYLEKSDLRQAVRDDPDFDTSTYVIEALVCPTSLDAGQPEALSYAANVGSWDGTAAINGVFGDGSRKLTSDKIPSGSEHTMAFAENLQATTWAIDPAPNTPITAYVGDVGIVWMDQYATNCNDALASNTPCVFPNTCMDVAVDGAVAFARPSSLHPNGAGMSFLTGRSQFINDDVDPAVYRTWILINE